MTDWLVDLSEFHALCVKPRGLKPSEVETILMNFLVHVPNHVAAAAKLMVDVPVTDVFGVGAVKAAAPKTEGPTPRGLTARPARRTPASRR